MGIAVGDYPHSGRPSIYVTNAGGVTQTEEIHSGGSYLSQSDTRIHFGLGSATKIDSAVIIWPSGKTDKLGSLAADKFYYVLEGQGIVPADKVRPSKKP